MRGLGLGGGECGDDCGNDCGKAGRWECGEVEEGWNGMEGLWVVIWAWLGVLVLVLVAVLVLVLCCGLVVWLGWVCSCCAVLCAWEETLEVRH